MIWITNSILLFYMDVVTHPYPNPDAGESNLCP